MRNRNGISHASVFYHAAVMAGSGVILQVLGFIYRMMQSRLVGAEGMGWFTLVMPVYSILTSVSLAGVSMAVNHLSAEADAVGDTEALPRIFRAGAVFFLGLFLIMAGMVAVFRGWIAESLIGKGEIAAALLLFLPCIFLTGFENLSKSVCYGVGRVRTPVISEIGEQTVRIAAVGAFLTMIKPVKPEDTVACIILGMTVSEVFSSLFMTVSLTRAFSRMKEGSGHFKRRIGRSVAVLAFPVSLSAIIGNLLSSAITMTLPQRLAAGGLQTQTAVASLGAINAMASPLFSLPLSFVFPIGAAVAPRIASRLARGEKRDAERKAGKAYEMAALIALPGCMAIFPVGGFLLERLFHVSPAGNDLLWLTVSTMLAGIQAVSGAVLTGYEKHRVSMASGLLGSLLHFLLMWHLSADPRFGVTGYLLGCVAGNLVPAAINTLYIVCALGLRLRFRRIFIRPITMAGISFLVERAVFLLAGESTFSVITALGSAFGVDILLLYVWDYQPIRYLRTLIPKKAKPPREEIHAE